MTAPIRIPAARLLRPSLLGLVLALSMTATALLGCGHRGPPPAATPPPSLPAVNPADLPLPDAIPGVFAVRQKLVARSAHGSGSFQAVLQKQPGKLTLVGLTPYGSRAFLLEQEGAAVKFTSYLPRDLPFPPTFMLLDIHRVFDGSLGPALADGQRVGVIRGETVRERWSGGRLVERSFSTSNDSGVPVTTSTVTYAGVGPAGLAAHVTLSNLRFGYTLSVETLPL